MCKIYLVEAHNNATHCHHIVGLYTNKQAALDHMTCGNVENNGNTYTFMAGQLDDEYTKEE